METNLIFSNASSSVKGITVSFGLLANKSAVFGWHKFGGGKPRSLRRKSNNFFLGTYSLNFAHGLEVLFKIVFFFVENSLFNFFRISKRLLENVHRQWKVTVVEDASVLCSYNRHFSFFLFLFFFLDLFLIFFCFFSFFLDGRNNFRWLSSE